MLYIYIEDGLIFKTTDNKWKELLLCLSVCLHCPKVTGKTGIYDIKRVFRVQVDSISVPGRQTHCFKE